MIKKLLFSFAILALTHFTSQAQYCTSSLYTVDCNTSGIGYIDDVSITGVGLINSGTGCNGSGTAYTYFTGSSNLTATLIRGNSYSLNVTGGLTSQIMSVWIDYNQNLAFDASEWSQIATASTIGANTSISITIPATAVIGQTRMRIRTRNAGFANASTDACTSFGSGETEDYDIIIATAAGAGCIASSQYPSATVVGPTTNGQSVIMTPTAQDCNYSGEFNLISLGTGSYTISSDNPTDYFTITNTSNTILFNGAQPLTFNITTAGTYRNHIFFDASCTPDQICRIVTITKNGAAATPPTVTTATVTAVTTNSANAGGNVTAAGSATVTARGVCYSTNANPTTSDLTVASGSGTGAFTASLSGLNPSTLYHVRAYAISTAGTSYGTDVTFTTTGPQGCIATTLYPSNTIVGPASNGSSVGITPASGNCNYAGEYASVSLTLGTYTLTSSTATDYLTVTTTTGTILASGVQPLSFSIATAGTYWMHVFKDNLCTSEGVCRGLTITKNSSTVAPAVTTTAATAITAGGATCGGNVTSAGSASVTARGICYATTANPTTANSTVASGSGTGIFTGNLTGLAAGTLYHFRAYATSSAGTSYGADLTFTTTAQALASVTTAAATAVTTTSANSGGNVTSIGGSPVTSRGVCYGTAPNPTLANNVISGGSGAGAFVSNLTGLLPNTSYYIRAYATNTAGTAYGTQVSFTTANPTPPVVNTAPASAVSFFTATLGGNVTSEGSSPVTNRGVCYSTTASPTIANSFISSGSGSGIFSGSASGLSGSTTYYARAFATNSVGTSYGANVTFTTLDPCVNSNEVYLTNLAFVDLATANATSTYYGTYVTPNAQGLPGLPAAISYNALNPYNLVNPGLPVRMKVKSYNNKTNGTSVVSGLCKLRTTDPNITISDSTAGLNNVGWHNEAWSTDEFEFTVSYSVFNSYTAYVEVVIVEGPNQYFTKCIPIPIRAFTVATLDVDDDNNPDSNGNNNDVVEPNETVEFLPYINNASTFSASYVAGFVMNFDYHSNVAVWDNQLGSSGNVYSKGWWNFSFGQPQPIPAGTLNTLPEYDFVFNYTYVAPYRFNLHLMMAGGFNLLNTPNNLTLMRTSTPLEFNSNYSTIPPTAVKAISASAGINVFPNPFTNEVSIRVKNGLEHAKYTITNSLGSIVESGYLNGTNTSLDLEKLAAGLYNLNINGQAGIKISKK